MSWTRTVLGFFVVGIGLAATGRADLVKSGLVLHLDAAIQIERAGKSAANDRWTNLAPGAEDAFQLHHLTVQPGGFSWTGDGSPQDPYALSFDGRQGYVTGSTSLERPALTLEIWARVNDVKQGPGIAARGATLLGNDFGQGGLSFLVARDGSPIILHDRQFSGVDATLPLNRWSQFVAVVRNEQTAVYLNGQPAGVVASPRTLDPERHGGCQLGTARMPDMDYVAADGLLGAIAIVRVYERSLSPREVSANFANDRVRFPIGSTDSLEPVTALPVPAIPGHATAPPVRAVKWDYVDHPVRASGPGWSSGLPGQTVVRAAFDGYPARLDQPYPPNQWRTDPAKTGESLYVTISYPQPVAVSRFVHYVDETPPRPAAWKDVEIQISEDLFQWRTLQQLRDLPPQSPQFLGIDQPTLARFYRIEIKSLAEGATAIVTNELETWYGTTIGNLLTESDAVQSEPYSFGVRLSGADPPLSGARLTVRAIDGTILKDPEIITPDPVTGSGATASVKLTPLVEGLLPLTLELRVGDLLIDQRPCVLAVRPKLTLQDMSPDGAVMVAAGDSVQLKGTVVNNGHTAASGVQVQWLGETVKLGSLAPGQAAPCVLMTRASAGYHEGLLSATADEHVRTQRRRAVLVPAGGQIEQTAGDAHIQYTSADRAVSWTAQLADCAEQVHGTWQLLADGKPCPLVMVPEKDAALMLAAAIPRGVLLMCPTVEQDDAQWRCRVIPDDPNPVATSWVSLDVRLAVEKPDVMFRPHLDWYTAAHGPNFPDLLNAHHSATRMLCVQSGAATVSLVPDTDNVLWGFTAEHCMTARFLVPLDARARLQRDRWRPITESPDCFNLTMPIRRGDWWAAYEHVVRDIFKFEQPRQWAMPLTQMQMLTTRELMSAQAWSEKHQIVRCLSDDSVFWTFYATAYATPALYQWYLATDNETARVKAEKMIDWLLRVQHQQEPMCGAWFSAYFDQGPDEKELMGGDFIRNRWLIAHATGAVVKTLLWYDRASGGQDPRVFAAARQGCDWLLKTMREDGGWPYAFDLDGQAITQACGAGQIWNTWALWRMYQVTGEDKYRDAALKSKTFFQKTYMDVHRYVGYWEDTVGITKENNKKIGSWEAYEPAIATLVFGEMDDIELALAAARDTAAWSWTRVTSTRQYETCYGQTTEQATCGPSQAQSPMVGVAFHSIYEKTGQPLWRDLSGAVKAVHFCADPDQEYGMVATSGWCIPQYAVAGPPYENTRPFVSPNMRRGDYGRQLWTGWCTDQFAWLALEWLVREANLRAPEYVQIDPESLRGVVLGEAGRIKMPEEKCDLMGLEHYDFNWVGYQNDHRYVLLAMNHKEAVHVLIRPHEAHLGVYTRPPEVLVGSGTAFQASEAERDGINWRVAIPEGGTAMLIWDRIQ